MRCARPKFAVSLLLLAGCFVAPACAHPRSEVRPRDCTQPDGPRHREAQTALPRPSDAAPVAVRSTEVTFATHYRWTSPALGQDRSIYVWKPPLLPGQRAPVLYVLDGGLDQDFPHIAGLAQLATVNNNFTPPIVVGIATQNRKRELTAPPTDPRFAAAGEPWGGAPAFRSYLVDEVLPFVQAHYPVSGQRVLAGESAAALFVVETWLRTPTHFTGYIAISPSLWYDAQLLAKQAAALLATHPAPPPRIYLTNADEGGTMTDGMRMVVAALRTHAPNAAHWTYIDRAATDHHWTIYHGAMLDALRWMWPEPAPTVPTVPAWFLQQDGAPPGYTPRAR